MMYEILRNGYLVIGGLIALILIANWVVQLVKWVRR